MRVDIMWKNICEKLNCCSNNTNWIEQIELKINGTKRVKCIINEYKIA